MKRRWPVLLILLVIAGLLLSGPPVADRLNRVLESPGMKGLRITDLEPLGAASALLLGGFRGVAIDVLWLRIIYLHHEREYASERSLIELLLKMQPDHKGVWVFQSWNIAYNISVQFTTARDQWPWIKDAITFLDRGIKLNPGSGDLLFAMGWIYYNKISQNAPETDEFIWRLQELKGISYFTYMLQKEEGVNNYEEAAKWFDRARKAPEPVTVMSARVVDSEVYQCYKARALQILRAAGLDNDLEFPAPSVTAAMKWVDKARFEVEGDAEHPGLFTRFAYALEGPFSSGFAAYPVRLDLIMASAYTEQISPALLEGNFTDEAYDRAQKILDKARSELAKYRPRYWDSRHRWVMVNEYEDLYSTIPFHTLRRFIIAMNHDDEQEARRMLRKAAEYLELAKAGFEAAGIVTTPLPKGEKEKEGAPPRTTTLTQLRMQYNLRRDQFQKVYGDLSDESE